MNSLSALIIENRPLPGIVETIEQHEKFLPKGTDVYWIKNEEINSIRDYNQLLLSKRLWRNIQSDRVLLFQWDSFLLKEGIEDFLQWDYIGAPWRFQAHGGNGGLSIRNPKMMLEIIDKVNWTGTPNEDIVYCNYMFENGMNLAPREECEKFSVESIFKLGTFGGHAIDVWLTPSECNQIRTQYSQL